MDFDNMGQGGFGQWGFIQNQQNDYGSPLVERILTTEYNLGVQQNNHALAGGALARLFGFFLARRAGR